MRTSKRNILKDIKDGRGDPQSPIGKILTDFAKRELPDFKFERQLPMYPKYEVSSDELKFDFHTGVTKAYFTLEVGDCAIPAAHLEPDYILTVLKICAHYLDEPERLSEAGWLWIRNKQRDLQNTKFYKQAESNRKFLKQFERAALDE